ncbi:MAG: DUF4139 domain-containing protein [Phycisphaerae bacterium]|nr:DUF4139 domain-containing protein [Phycisphaerae bacterium]
MNTHLTQKELIEYQFGLAGPNETQRIAKHIETCADCSKMAEQLKGKFSSLELLRDDAKANDELIRRTIEQAKKQVPRKIIILKRPLWLGAAAAVILLCLVLMLPDSAEQKKQDGGIARHDVPEPKALHKENSRQLALNIDSDIKAERIVAKPMAKMTAADTVGTLLEAEDDISEKPPFAPASAIELVTLPRRDNVQITVYNSADLTLVRERRNLTLKKGWNWLQFMWANTLIDPTSLSLEPLKQSDKIEIQQLVYPAGLKDIGRWLIRSKVEGQVPFEITYFTSGLSWRAFYMGTLSADERKMRLEGYVRVENNSGEDYENAQTRLIVGKIHQLDQIAELAKRQYPYGSPIQEWFEDNVKFDGKGIKNNRPDIGGKFNNYDADLDFAMGGDKPKEIIKEGLSEYFLYTIEGTETIEDKWGKRLISFEADDVNVTSLYKYDDQRWGGRTMRFVSFANDKEHNLGETPIPNGDVRIYSLADTDSRLSYIGGTNVKYIPVDEDVELDLGQARLVKVEPVLMHFAKTDFVFDEKGNITGWDEICFWKVDVTNTRKLPVEIEITRGFTTAYWSIEYEKEKAAYEKHDATHARFKLKLEPETKQNFTYTVTTSHGIREQLSKENNTNFISNSIQEILQ